MHMRTKTEKLRYEYERDPHLKTRIDLTLKYCKGRCLDIGCGDGFISEKISKKLLNNSHVGIDVNFKDIKKAKKRELINFKFVVGNIEKMNLNLESKFDKESISSLLKQIGVSYKFIQTSFRIPFSRRLSQKNKIFSKICYYVSRIFANIFKEKNYDFCIIVKGCEQL